MLRTGAVSSSTVTSSSNTSMYSSSSLSLCAFFFLKFLVVACFKGDTMLHLFFTVYNYEMSG